MVTVTIVVSAKMVYVDYRVMSDDKLEFIGSGIRIYVRKEHDKIRYDAKRKQSVSHLAMLVAQEHKIPVATLRRASKEARRRAKKSKVSDKQMKLL